ncbi:hypothetical protein [Sneathiella sp. HT1-7]|jgi:hypothetical protein|uniref:hypothetical protein n=1 Tax=Sneathiella sp. HT1-7 TaxID=2887192 RepID=UPI001D145564|nr:hypothetical protein [Sneathiella sp. HT1-7]MCC3304076.1 hypothetical protein [Sneathiella sp. HT1-7]
MKRFTAICAVLLFGLSACAQSPTASQPETEKPKKAAAIFAPQKSTSKSVVPKPALKPPVVAAIKPRILLEPAVVIGKTSTEIKNAFGDPNLLRQDSPAEVWQYLAQGCALHLFFYPGTSGEALVVRHIAINGRSIENFSDLDRKQCFNDHLKAVGAEETFVAKKAS